MESYGTRSGRRNTHELVQSSVGKYAIGPVLGKGTYGVVKLVRHVETNKEFAMKILHKRKIATYKEQVKREITAMRCINHPNVVQIHEVMASKSKIYMVMELVSGGQIRQKLINHPNKKLDENEARLYFQQLIDALEYCHKRGIYHRDIKLENLLLDTEGQLKVCDFGSCALSRRLCEDGQLLHSKRGTLAYMAPEMLAGRPYYGDTVDLWSCGVTLFALISGKAPFVDAGNIQEPQNGEEIVECPADLFSQGARRLIQRILDPNPVSRIIIPDILRDTWFQIDYRPTRWIDDSPKLRPISVRAIVQPVMMMNAFQLFSTSHGFDIAKLFQNQVTHHVNRAVKFKLNFPGSMVITNLENEVKRMGFRVQKYSLEMKLTNETRGRKGRLMMVTKVYDLAKRMTMVEITKVAGDTLEFREFCMDFLARWETGIRNYYALMLEMI